MRPRRVLTTCALALALAGCTPDQAARPTPTADLRPTARPTARPARSQLGGSDARLATRLPGQVEQVAVTVSPDGWPVLSALAYWNFSPDPARVYAQVYDPDAHRWGPMVQLDIGASSLGSDAFHGAALAVTPQGTIWAAWGASDGDGGIWASSSSDYGRSWSAPERLNTGCWHVSSAAATPDGQLIILAMCVHGSRDQNGAGPTILTRTPAGQWLPPQRIEVVAWEGALVVSGDQILGLVLPHLGGDRPRWGYIISRELADPRAGWQTQLVSLAPAGVEAEALGLYGWHLQGTAIAGGALFTWAGYDRPSAFALVVRDGQVQPARAIIAGTEPSRDRQRSVWYAAPAYDPASDRLAALWACCGSPLDHKPSTQYGAWAAPGGVWQAALSEEAAQAEGVPLALGGRQVEALSAAQAAGSRTVWVAWVEGGQEVVVRSLPIDQLVPPAEEPTPTPEPTEVAP
jgi:hypothetical protein